MAGPSLCVRERDELDSIEILLDETGAPKRADSQSIADRLRMFVDDHIGTASALDVLGDTVRELQDEGDALRVRLAEVERENQELIRDANITRAIRRSRKGHDPGISCSCEIDADDGETIVRECAVHAEQRQRLERERDDVKEVLRVWGPIFWGPPQEGWWPEVALRALGESDG